MLKKDLSIIPLFGVPFFSGTKDELLSILQAKLEERMRSKLVTVYTPNPEQIVLSSKDSVFARVLSQAFVNIPDGQGIVWAISKRHPSLRSNLKRIAGREVFHDLLVIAKEKKIPVFLLGGRSGSAREVIAKYGMDWEYDEGALSISTESREERERVLQKIQAFHPALLFVAYGAPWQEKWVDTNREALERAGVKVAMVVGGSFEYESGKVARVSPLVDSLHLEWLQRLVTQPWRWKRQLTGLQFFLWVLLGKD